MRRTLFLLALLQLSMTVAFSPVAPLTVKRQVSNVAWSGKPAAFVHPVLHNSLRPQFSLRRTRQVLALEAKIEYDEQEPEWLPLIMPGSPNLDQGENTTVMPLFPLGATVYTPFTEHRLNIFEPRYRTMYNDILFSGARRFAVCTTNPNDGTFSKYAAVFYLKELKEVSEQTGDKVKFICDHEVTGRLRIDKILNPSAWIDASTYLKVEGELMEDEEEEEASMTAGETEFMEEYKTLMELQHELDEDVKFTKESVNNLQVSAGEPFWATVAMWQVFQQQRVLARQQEMQKEFQERLIAHLMKESGGSKLPDMINISDLPPELKAEVKALQQRMADDLAPLQTRDNYDLQLLMETHSHTDRLSLLQGMISKERSRLQMKRQLKGLFSA